MWTLKKRSREQSGRLKNEMYITRQSMNFAGLFFSILIWFFCSRQKARTGAGTIHAALYPPAKGTPYQPCRGFQHGCATSSTSYRTDLKEKAQRQPRSDLYAIRIKIGVILVQFYFGKFLTYSILYVIMYIEVRYKPNPERRKSHEH